MAQETRELKRRIKGVANTRKITKAMELVAASKMRRAVQAALATRGYAVRAWELLVNLSTVTDERHHPLLHKRTPKRALVIVFASDRGLAGGLNTQILRTAADTLRAFGVIPVEVVTVGRKAEEGMVRLGAKVIASFPAPTRQPTLADVLPLSKISIAQYLVGQYDQVIMITTDYLSPISQKPSVRVILPITAASLQEIIAGTGPIHASAAASSAELREYIFEPSPDKVLDAMLERLVESQLYQALLEASASEQAARMLAMRNATDAATDLIDELTLEFNKARQSGITKDLAEISASKIALS